MSSPLTPILMLAWPFIEIAGFIIVGSHIGVLATLGLVVLSAVLGMVLLRFQGISLLQRIQAESLAGRVPDRELVHGAMLVLAAILLIIPGFVSSIIGLLLFIPFIRDLVWNKFIRNRMVVATASSYTDGYSNNYHRDERLQDRIIDLEPDDYSSKPDENSPWNPNRKDQ